MSGAASQAMRGGPARFLSLRRAGCFGRQSATAAAITSQSQPRTWRRTAASISAAVVTGTKRAPRGGASATGPETSTTSWPARRAASATA